ncbi:hypothetical protein AHAS_Ahas11G0324200 [Arachis hypogaea]
MRSFLWKEQVDERCLNLVKWETVITPRKFGGLCVRDMKCVNLALIGKLLWQYLHSPNKLWVQVLKAKYVPDFLMESRDFIGVSSTWRDIMKTKIKMQQGFSWNAGSVPQSFWFRKWHPDGCLTAFIPFVHITDTTLRVDDVWSHDYWN